MPARPARGHGRGAIATIGFDRGSRAQSGVHDPVIVTAMTDLPVAVRTPDMSVVIVTPEGYGIIRKTVLALGRQTVRGRLELVIAAPSRERLAVAEADLAEFHSWRVVEVGEVRVLTRAKVAAVAQATAPIVAFAEDHCFPDPMWAEALIAMHRQGHSAVGPMMRNANPATSLSWAGLFLHFGCCVRPIRDGGCTSLPWHNTSYKRERLADYGPNLASMLMVEGILLDDLLAKGHTLGFQPAARTDHVNISVLSSWVRHAFWGGRLFGAMRARHNAWPWWKRAAYVAGSPAIPVVRLHRAWKGVGDARDNVPLPLLFAAMVAGLVPHAVGETVGYACGAGNAEERYSHFEMRRFLHVVARERPQLFG